MVSVDKLVSVEKVVIVDDESSVPFACFEGKVSVIENCRIALWSWILLRRWLAFSSWLGLRMRPLLVTKEN